MMDQFIDPNGRFVLLTKGIILECKFTFIDSMLDAFGKAS